MKTCPSCKKSLPLDLDNFYWQKKTRRGNGYYSYLCKPCSSLRTAKYKSENKEKVAIMEHKYINTEAGFVGQVISGIFSRFKKNNDRKKWIPECTREQIYDELKLYMQEHGRICEYCKEPWTYIRKIGTRGEGHKKRGPTVNTNFSLDRLDSTKTYGVKNPALNQVSNLVFCCIGCNDRKNQVTLSDIDNIKRVWRERNEVD